jgi:flagellar biosynthesis protein FliR
LSVALTEALQGYILIFCRLGAAFTLMPGFAFARMPVPIRLLLALAISIAITPVVIASSRAPAASVSSVQMAMLSEVMIGIGFGFWCFCFLHASRFAANIIASVVGLAGIPGQSIEDQEPSSHLATLLSLVATIFIFAAELHLMSLSALMRSYQTMPLQTIPTSDWLAMGSVKLVRDTSVIAVQMASPFIVFTVVVNLSLGLCGKFTPQLQVYFAAMGLTILISFLLLILLMPGLPQLGVQAYASWLLESL